MLRLGLRPDASEVQAARAAAGARIFYTLSTVSVCPIEEVARGATRQPWSQLYVLKPQLHAQRPWVVLGGWDEDACVHR